ncbi:MAG TPA: Scr1 family TA system antitoxin-like transcriptional regulator [Pseudonocardiaceae bacterium]|nr:Scr1 family TA system antitoxin-like transcriptional regulator [Pseudonocardiaceae bacterium]
MAHEAVVRELPGGAEDPFGQLLYLSTMTGWCRARVRVVPVERERCLAGTGGFEVLRFAR